MAYQKGQSGNPKGRPQGAENAKTKELRALLKTAIAAELSALPETLAALSAEKRLEIIAKMLPYCLPRIEPTKYNFDESTSWGIEI